MRLILYLADNHGSRKVADLEAHEMARLEQDAKLIIKAYEEQSLKVKNTIDQESAQSQ